LVARQRSSSPGTRSAPTMAAAWRSRLPAWVGQLSRIRRTTWTGSRQSALRCCWYCRSRSKGPRRSSCSSSQSAKISRGTSSCGASAMALQNPASSASDGNMFQPPSQAPGESQALLGPVLGRASRGRRNPWDTLRLAPALGKRPGFLHADHFQRRRHHVLRAVSYPGGRCLSSVPSIAVCRSSGRWVLRLACACRCDRHISDGSVHRDEDATEVSARPAFDRVRGRWRIRM
jgi:hypothetical protein